MKIVLGTSQHPPVNKDQDHAIFQASRLEESAIQVHALTKSYPRGVKALAGLSFCVQTGSVFALLGPNGAGKSTTVRILCTLMSPDGGSAFVCNHNVAHSPKEVRRLIGCVSQGHSSDPDATGYENLLLQGTLHGLRGANLRNAVDRMLEQFDLTCVAGRMVRTYSGGTERRLDIALSLVHGPKVLFLDEPTTGLDPEARYQLWEIVRTLRKNNEITILLTTHYLEEADRVADRVAFVNRGQIVASGTPAALKNSISGDGIEIEVNDHGEQNQVLSIISGLTAVQRVEVDDSALLADVMDIMGALGMILCELGRAGLPVRSVRPINPTLDDVYLCHASNHRDSRQGETIQ